MAKRQTPELNLQPEQQKVLSTDFNLFYVPQEAPLPSGVKEFTASLNNFVNGGLMKASIGAEVKMKKSEKAKAIKDYNENRLKFRDAVKNGEIPKEANPYYLEKYKELSLNSWANQFTDKVTKKYSELDVGNNITEGAFESFYKDELKKFIKDNELGIFSPEELEGSFFKKTSLYRNSLEATHKSNLMDNFNQNFDDKILENILGTIELNKDVELNILNTDGQSQSKWEVIADKLQNNIQEIIDVTGNGRSVIDTVFGGLESYVQTTDDYEFALELIQKVPELLIAGTGTVSEIGRIKNRVLSLTQTLHKAQNERITQAVKFEENRQKEVTIKTYNNLSALKKQNPEMSVTKWLSEPNRTQEEINAGEAFLIDQQFNGGSSDNIEVIQEIESLMDNGQYVDANKLVSNMFRQNKIRLATKDKYLNITIPNAWNNRGNEYWTPVIRGELKMIEEIVEKTSVGGDKTKGIQATAYLKAKINQWLEDNKQFNGTENNKSEALEIYFIQTIDKMQKYGGFQELWSVGASGFEGKGTVVQNIDTKIKEAQEDPNSQVKADLIVLEEDAFKKKYGMKKKSKRKELGI